MRTEWNMVFSSGGVEALQALERQSFDIVVTDLKMPGMNGVELLEEVRKRSPQSLRMILSGQADRETILRSVNPTHQYLSKPCEGEELKSRLVRAFALRDLLSNPELKEVVSRLDSLPSLPSLYLELNEELNKTEQSLEKVSRLIAADMAMTAKILQLVNSAFFGLQVQVSDAKRAIALLGFDVVKSLVLSAHIFSSFKTNLLSDGDLQYLWQHSARSANYAKVIAKEEHSDQKMTDDCFTAALLHDAGKLVMAFALRERYEAVIERVRREQELGVYEAERDIFGCSHAEVAAYLFGLWSLPSRIVEAVAWHHTPSESPGEEFSVAAAVHLGSIFDEDARRHWMGDKTQVDYGFLMRIGCLQREKDWRKRMFEADAER